MMAALSEWFSGTYQPYTGDISLFFGHWKDLVEQLVIEVRRTMDEDSIRWQTYLSRLNHRCATNSDVEPKKPVCELPLPPI